MIKSLTIENYQSHKNSFLEFSTGINVISGQSNNGKTAILRALNWVITNRPQGIAFKSTFSDKKETCRVSLIINDTEIIRERNNSINSYQIGSSFLYKDNTYFTTIGNDVPSEVSSAINISDINCASQFERHFLLMDSPGEVGRTINKVVKLDDIDALISNISSKITSTNKELDIKKQDLDKLNLSLEKFKDYDLIENLVNQIVEYDSKVKTIENKVKLLSYIVTEGVRVEAIITSIENRYEGLEDEIKVLEQVWLDYNTNLALMRDLGKITIDLAILDINIEATETILKQGEGLPELESNVIKYLATSDVLNKIMNLKKDWDGYFESMKKDEKLIIVYKNEFDALLKEIGICPLCERVTT